MFAVDEDLRHRRSTAGALHHFGSALRVRHDVDLLIRHLAVVQGELAPDAVGADHRAIDFDFRHSTPLQWGQPSHGRPSIDRLSGSFWQGSAAQSDRTTFARASTSTLRAPAEINALAADSTVAPVVITSSIR